MSAAILKKYSNMDRVSNTENHIATVTKPTVSTQLEFNREDIVRTFELLCHGPGNVVEVRVPIAYTNPEFTKVISDTP